MANTIAKSKRGANINGVFREVTADITFTDVYPATGYPLTAAQFGGRKIENVKVVAGNPASARLLFVWDNVSAVKALRVFYPTGGAAASPAALADPAITAAGTGQNPIIPGRAKEVATGTDLSTITVTVIVTMS